MFWNLLSTFIGIGAAVQETSAAVKAANFNRNMAAYNANVTRQTGKMEEDRVRRDARKRTGLMIANIGASGVSGAEDLLAESIYEGELDALTTRFNYASQAAGYEQQSSMYGAAAGDARKSGFMNAAASLLRGASNQYKNENDYGAGETPFRLGGK
jgi:hypothetical protein